MRSTTVRCRTNPRITLLVNVDDDGSVHMTSVRFTNNQVRRAYDHERMPNAKRWWGEFISSVDPRDREALHKFLGLS